jgi:2-polyprenyl-3-methyl-5-hydroxy-6-metoxy-1,4-benzoquinol methylase
MDGFLRVDKSDARRVAKAGQDVRYVPQEGRLDLVGVSHETRYLWAMDHLPLEGASVLDFGCGSGYGTALLAERAAAVCGVDVCEEAIAFARRLHTKKNLRYSRGNACSPVLPQELTPHAYDIVVSFEVIEHIERYFDYLENVCLLLKESGRFLLSTPNRLQTFAWNSTWNSCHFQEFSAYQLRRILGLYFGRVHLIGQGLRDEAQREAIQREFTYRAALRERAPMIRTVHKTWHSIVKRVRPGRYRPEKMLRHSDMQFAWEPGDDILDRAFWIMALCEQPRGLSARGSGDPSRATSAQSLP